MNQFDDWRSLFIVAINNKDQSLVEHLRTCSDFLNQIIENGALLPPNTIYTESFLKDTLLQAIREILKINITFNTKSLANHLISFIKSCLSLFPWAYLNDRIDFFSTLTDIMNPNQNLYKSISTSIMNQPAVGKKKSNKYVYTPPKVTTPNPINDIKNYFISHELFTVMLLRFKNAEIPILLEHLHFFLYHYDKLKDKINEKTSLALLYNFFNYFQSFMVDNIISSKVNLIDQKQILSIFGFIFSLASIYEIEVPDSTLDLIFNYGNNLIQNKTLDAQLFGTSIFKSFVESGDRNLNFFAEKIKKTNFVSDFMSRDLHSDVIENTIPILTTLSTKNCVTTNDIKQIYLISKNVHATQKEKVISLVDAMLQEMPITEIPNFFNANMSESVEYLKLVSNFLRQKKDMPQELAEDFVSKLINIGSNIYDRNKVDGNAVINQAISPLYGLKHKRLVLQNCISFLMKEFNVFRVLVLSDIAKNCVNSLRTDFNSEIFDKLCKYLSSLDETKRCSIYSLIYLISKPLNKTIPVSLLREIMNPCDNSIWKLFTALMIQSGLDAFERDSVMFIAEFITNMKEMPENRNFAEFFKIFMLLYNVLFNRIEIVKSGRSRKIIPTNYTVTKTPLFFEDKLIDQIIAFSNNDICDVSCKTLLDIYSRLKIKSESFRIFKELLGKCKNDTQLIRVINLIYEFCVKNDNESVTKYISHSFNSKNMKIEAKNKMFIKVEYNLDKPDPPNNEIIELAVEKNSPVQIILALLSPNLPEASSKYMITVGGNEKTDCKICSADGFSSNKVVSIKNRNAFQSFPNKNILNNGSPSEYFKILGLSKILIDYLRENVVEISDDKNDKKKKRKKVYSEDLIKFIWKLICYLPNDEELEELSARPEEFLDELNKAKDIYYIRYLLQILLWRLSSKTYENIYLKLIQQLLTEIVNKNELTIFCADEIVRLLEIYQSPIMVVPALKILANDDIKESTKNIAVLIISKMDFDPTSVIDNKSNIDLIMKAIAIMSQKSWEQFKVFLDKCQNKKSLFSMSINALKKNLPNSSFFTELFSLYLPNFLSEDSKNQIDLCLKLLKKNMSIGLATALNTLINFKVCKAKNGKCESLAPIVDEVASIISLCNNSGVLNKLFNCISIINANDPQSRPNIDKIIDKVNNLQVERWSFVPEIQTVEYRGLRNLQATCYMNADLQQLYHIPAFRYLLSKEGTTGLDDDKRDFINSLQYLMDDMTLMKTRYCDTANFFYCFSKLHGGIFETNQQQDAQEFLTFFLDDLPQNTKKLFQGYMLNTIKEKNSDESNDEIDENDSALIQQEESFITLSIPIKEVNDMYESLSSISQKQVLFGDNQYMLPDGRKIDAEKFQMIKVAPPVLIVQLKRFEYDMTTHQRIKINKEFEILNNICLKELMTSENKNDSEYNYTLHGVVVHRGEGTHGHYTSLINLDGGWHKFDDIDVQKVDEKTYRKEAFGIAESENKNNNKVDDFDFYMLDNISGYILFYVNDDFKVDDKLLLDNSFDISIPEEKRESIEKENKSYLFEQFAFLEPTFHFFNEISTPEQLRDYFFNIYSHSKENAQELSLLIVERMKELYGSDPSLISSLINWMSDNFKDKVLEIYLHCSVINIVDALTDLIIFCCSNSLIDDSGAFIGLFILELQQLIPKWRQITEISKMILQYLKISAENVKFAQNNGWSDLLIIFINEVFNNSLSENSLKMINISEIFMIIKLIVSLENASSYVELPSIREFVSKSPSSYGAYKSLLVKCASMKILDTAELSKIIPEEFSRPKMMEMYLSEVQSNTFNEIVVKKLEIELKYNRHLIMEYFISKKKEYRSILIDNSEYLIQSLLMTGNEFNNLASKTENLMIEFYDNKDLSLDAKKCALNKMLDIIPTMSARKEITSFSHFLHVLLLLMKATDFPRNTKIKGLESIKSDSEYMLAISAYSDSSQLLSIFESKADKLIRSGISGSTSLVSANKFVSEFKAVLEIVPDELFILLINKSEWRPIIDKYKSSYSNYDLIPIQQLSEVVIKRIPAFMSLDEVPVDYVNQSIDFAIRIMTMNNVCDPKYAANLARFLPRLIDYVREPRVIETILNVVSNTVKSSTLNGNQITELINNYFLLPAKFIYMHTNTSPYTNKVDVIQTVSDKEATFYRDAFKNLAVRPIDDAVSFASNAKRENALVVIDLLACIAAMNADYANELVIFAESRLNMISNRVGNGKKTVDNYIAASLLFRIQMIPVVPNSDVMEKFVCQFNKASGGFQQAGKRETLFIVLNELQNRKTGAWPGAFASKVFVEAKFTGSEEKAFFRKALEKINNKETALNLIVSCQNAFKFIEKLQPRESQEAAVQFEKIAVLISAFRKHFIRAEIISHFNIDKDWKEQSSKHGKAFEDIYGPD